MKVYNRNSIITIMMIVLVLNFCFILYPAAYVKAESDTTGRIAFVDLWAVFNAHPEKTAAETELNQLAQTMQAELEEEAKGLPADEQQELLKEYQGKLTQREQELIQDIIDSIKEVVIKIAEEKEVKMVLEKTNVIYGGYDMTEEVITFIEQNYLAGDSKSTDLNTENEEETNIENEEEINISINEDSFTEGDPGISLNDNSVVE